ncbi:MAG: hypothetical protein ACP5QG_09255 [candidate division WOR-3 bacterium]
MLRARINIPKEELETARDAGRNVNVSLPAELIARLPKDAQGMPVIGVPEEICPTDKYFSRIKYSYFHRLDLYNLRGLNTATFFNVAPPAPPLSNYTNIGLKLNAIIWGWRLTLEPQPLRAANSAAPDGWELEWITAVSMAVVTPSVEITSRVTAPPYRVADAWGGVDFIEAGGAGAINAWPIIKPSPYAKFQKPLVVSDTEAVNFTVTSPVAFPGSGVGPANPNEAWMCLSILVDVYDNARDFAVAKDILRKKALI